jgi:hypothetical protein
MLLSNNEIYKTQKMTFQEKNIPPPTRKIELHQGPCSSTNSRGAPKSHPPAPSPAGALGAPYSTGRVVRPPRSHGFHPIVGARPSPAASTTTWMELALIRAGPCSSTLLAPPSPAMPSSSPTPGRSLRPG